ncbi:hypothetical protein OM2255_13679 [alpha proteobacterium HTCC2255]|nr:hypothetical protein OM2255_13679 [alpha proteobacterium HTCC2255] [Rhodobacterales bacterium HTCC2255]
MIRNNKIKLLHLTSLLVIFIIAASYFSDDLVSTEVEKEPCNHERPLRSTHICEND